MLGADHALVRRRDGALELRPLGPRELTRARELAQAFLAAARGAVGGSRQELDQALDRVPFQPRERRLAAGIRTLVEQACTIDADASVDPRRVRSELFLLAAERHAAAETGGAVTRASILEEAGARLAMPPEQIEQTMYADLRSAHRLGAVEPLAPDALVERWAVGQLQAVLLRATRIVAEVRAGSPQAYRLLFRRLKFHRLLHTIVATGDGYRVEIDGPYSLFESVTKYGLGLALVVPALLECDALTLEAELRWGRAREPIRFRHAARRGPGGGAGRAEAPPRAPELDALVEAFGRLGSPWQVRAATTLLSVPGVGVCVPDLEFMHGPSDRRVFLEMLGFWSRDAVWRRMDLIEKGVGLQLIFAVSERLRVSEEILPAGLGASLYVFKGAMSARAVLERCEALRTAGT